MNSSRSALIVSAWVVGIPCGKSWYVFRVPFAAVRPTTARIGVRHDLIVLAVHHQNRDGDLLQVFGEVGLGERDDAVVVRLGAAHHSLAPPVLDVRFGRFDAGRLNP